MNSVPTESVDYDPFAGPALAGVVPTTEAQREIWLADRLSREASLAYNESISLRLGGTLDVAVLRRSLADLVQRHESLRATFSEDGHSMQIAVEQELTLALRDLAALDSVARDLAVDAARHEAVETAFDLERGPLVRFVLLRLAADQHILIVTAHHIICDGYSFGVIVRDLAALYTAQASQSPAELPAADRYSDYVNDELAFVTSDAGLDDERFWIAKFHGQAPVLELPRDRPRAAWRTFASRREDHALDADLTAQLRKLGASHGASLFATLLGGFAALLNRLTGSEDVIIGVPAAGQSATSREQLVGHCVNLLPIPVAVASGQSFGGLLKATRTSVLDAYEHQRFTFGSLLKKLALQRDPSRLPLVSVIFNLDQAVEGDAIRLGALSAEFAGNPRSFENFELFINVVQDRGTLRVECQYNTDLFDVATVQRWLASYETLLRAACAQPDSAAGALPITSDDDLQTLRAWNATEVEYPREAFIHELVRAQIGANASRVAVISGDRTLTYAELGTRANAIAQALRARGAEGKLVGICLEREIDLLPAMLGILEAGAAYVPLDPAYPRDRLAFMVEDARIAALITHSALGQQFDYPRDKQLWLDTQASELAAEAAAVAAPQTSAPSATSAQSLAYVIYTSGSTGKPKGVLVPHRPVVNLLQAVTRQYELTRDDRLLAVSSISFDIHVIDVWAALSVGSTVVLASREATTDGASLRALIDDHGVTYLQATPSTWRLLLEADLRAPRLKATSTGEPLPADLAITLAPRVGQLWNMYGPTETTVWSTGTRVPDPRAPITIGLPLANQTIWILDAHGRICPIGVPGEMHIGGEGVTRGYLNRPELDAERFIADPHTQRHGAMLYRTGDRGRWNNAGQVEHLGRLDFQVKVRGYRIELGEIEAQLASHASVARAIVITREDRAGDVRLVAYVVAKPAQNLSVDTLKEHLQRALPAYMIPQHFVMLDAIPLLPNGKLNRKALPAPELPARSAADFIAPGTDTEKQVAAMMEEVLGLPGVGLHDDFFALGGHSLLAAQLTSKLNRGFGVSLPLKTLFEAPTIGKLASAITAAAGTGGAMQIPRRADQSSAPLSMNQQRLWFLEELNPGRVVYNTPSAHRLRGALDAKLFDAAFRELVKRQPVLRTSIERVGSDVRQRVHDEVATSLLPIEDLSGLPASEREAQLMSRLEALVDTPFDLLAAPLFRAKLFRLAQDEHAFFFMPHHIIWDGWSFDLFYEDIAAIYGAMLDAKPSPLAPLKVTYGDYSAWHRDWVQTPEFERQIAFWRERLIRGSGARELPTDLPRRPGMSGGGATEWLDIDTRSKDALHALSRDCDATVFMTTLAAYAVLLQKTSGLDHLVIGTPVRGRASPEVESLMGYFTNLLPLHIDVDSQQSFHALVRHVKTVVLDAFTYPDVPLETVMRDAEAQHGGGGSLLYQALFSFQDARQRVTRWGNLEHEQIQLFQRGATEDLGLWVMEKHHGMVGGVTYNTDIIVQPTAQLLRDRYVALLDSLTARPEVPLAQISLLSAADRARLEALNDTQTAFDAPVTIHGIVEQIAVAQPERAAITDGGWGLNYRDLNQRANRIARALTARGIGPDDTVIVMLPRNMSVAVGMLGVLKTGAAVCLAEPGEFAGDGATMPDGTKALVCTAESRRNVEKLPGIVLEVDTAGPELAALSADPLEEPQYSPNAPAAIVRHVTRSGARATTTLSHHALRNVLLGAGQVLKFDAGDVFLAATPASFDSALVEMLLPLVWGATLAISGEQAVRDPVALKADLEATKATAVHLMSSAWAGLIDAGWPGAKSLRALHSGAPMSVELAEDVIARTAALYTIYGHAETGIWSTIERSTSTDQGIACGKPLANFRVTVLDASGQPAALGTAGTVTVSALGIPQTATGDRGRWRADARLEILPREDDVITIDRQQIDLAFIVRVLRAHPEVRDAATVVATTHRDRPSVYAYVVAKDSSVETAALRQHLAQSLPVQLQPHGVILVESLPRRADGSLDAAALPRPEALHRAASASAQEQPQTGTEKQIAALWASLLGIANISVRDNFFDLGGHSLLAMQAIATMEKDTGKRINPRRYLFESLAQVAKAYDEAESQQAAPEPKKAGFLKRLFGSKSEDG